MTTNLGYSAQRLLQLVRQRPGIHLREAQRQTGLGLGDTVYQLRKLVSLGLVGSSMMGKYKRYYPASIGAYERKLFSTLLVPSRRRILLLLLANRESSLTEIAAKLNLSKSTINWHLRILLSDDIVKIEPKNELGPNPRYQLVEPTTVTALVSKLKLSTIDKLSEGFLESWDLLDVGSD